jgi:hypothetical protein
MVRHEIVVHISDRMQSKHLHHEPVFERRFSSISKYMHIKIWVLNRVKSVKTIVSNHHQPLLYCIGLTTINLITVFIIWVTRTSLKFFLPTYVTSINSISSTYWDSSLGYYKNYRPHWILPIDIRQNRQLVWLNHSKLHPLYDWNYSTLITGHI